MVAERQMSEEPEVSETVYRTRSGRLVRQVPRYQPDENTIFVDEESPDSDYLPPITDSQEEDSGEETARTVVLSDVDTSANTDTYQTDSSSGTDSGSLTYSDSESSLASLLNDDEPDFDILDWDNLTDNANSDDESSEDDEFDDDEEDTEVI